MILKTAILLLMATVTISSAEKTLDEDASITMEGSSQQLKDGKRWALLVAGSHHWGNYRHQASVCHAYQILLQRGIPKENIVVMMYNDIANNTLNPNKGVIINQPYGPNVYNGVRIDYNGTEVNPANFLAVLQGNSSAVRHNGTGRVINSTQNDNIFVYFAGNGLTGSFLFQDTELNKTTLQKTLENMENKKVFRKMLWFVDADASGSMFEDLQTERILAITSCNSYEPAQPYYYDKRLKTSLATIFTKYWMYFAETSNVYIATLFEYVRYWCCCETVSSYGAQSISCSTLSEFLGNNGVESKLSGRPLSNIPVSCDRKLPPPTEELEDICV